MFPGWIGRLVEIRKQVPNEIKDEMQNALLRNGRHKRASQPDELQTRNVRKEYCAECEAIIVIA